MNNEVEMTIEHLDAVNGGRQNWSSPAWANVRDGMIAGFEAAGGTVTGSLTDRKLTWSAGGNTVHF